MKAIKRIGVLTSGGDSPGMNAAIRAVVRTGIYYGIEVMGIRRGYQGLIEGDVYKMATTDVSNIIQRGGTILKTARSKDFMTEEGRAIAYRQLQEQQIDALVLIGGDGTFRGATALLSAYPIRAIGIPGTIDKDLHGSDFTIGFDTAVNTAVEAIDKIRDTAEAHDRLFVVEVMGRDAGYIALNSGISCGAEDILLPETPTQIQAVIQRIKSDEQRKKMVHIIVVAEGDDFGGAADMVALLKNEFPHKEPRATILGHIQRGGAPTYADRVLASRLGHAAVLALRNGQSMEMAGIINNQVCFTPFEKVTKQNVCLQKDMLQLIDVLSK